MSERAVASLNFLMVSSDEEFELVLHTCANKGLSESPSAHLVFSYQIVL
jgi:hypothetical protein